jgi:glyoxylase-like metal-dependent hydrolase (beta-lactamase superfamily II)
MREFGSEGKHWSPCASTLVTGDAEAVLADTGHIKSDVSALGDMIEQTGTRLTTIYITHGHLDHFLGIGQLMKRFPDARPVASAAVVADIKSSVAEQEKQWQRRFGDDVDRTAVIPEPLDGNVIDLVPRGSRAARDRRPAGRHLPEHGHPYPVDRHRDRG